MYMNLYAANVNSDVIRDVIRIYIVMFDIIPCWWIGKL